LKTGALETGPRSKGHLGARAGDWLEANRTSIGTWFVLGVLYAVVAAASFQGYYTKWYMSDDYAKQSLTSMMDGSADRPYVYRQLLPQLANAIEAALPESVRAAITTRLVEAKGALSSPGGRDARKEGYELRYRIVYYGIFLCLFLSLFVLRSICISAGVDQASASAAPAIFALMVPILQTRGGFFYDLSEILALSLAVRFALSGRAIALLVLAVPATANKESFLFFILALLPLLTQRLPLRSALSTIAGTVVISGATYLYIRSIYAGNGGDNVIFQLFKNLPFYANPLNLLKPDQTYGLPLFKGYGAIVIGWFGVLMVYGWRIVPDYIRQHLVLAALINLPLFLLFCAEGEMRNLSMLYVATVVLIAGALQRWIGTQVPGLGR